MNREEFTTIAKRIVGFQKGLKNHKIIHPTRDWFIGLFMALMIFFVSAAWSATTHQKYQNTTISTGITSEEDVVVYREALVKAALEELSKRQKRLSTYTKQGISPVNESPTVASEGEEGHDNELDIEDMVEELSGAADGGVDVTSTTTEEVDSEAVESPENTAPPKPNFQQSDILDEMQPEPN